MASYLKKTKIRKIAEYLGYELPAPTVCEYKSGRGAEWYIFYDESKDMMVKIFRDNAVLLVLEYADALSNGFQTAESTRAKSYSGKERGTLERVALLDNGNTIHS